MKNRKEIYNRIDGCRYLIDNYVSLKDEELNLALLCVGYLSLPEFDADIEQSEIDSYIPTGSYGFLDYAYAYWSRHVERSFTLQDKMESLDDLVEAITVFFGMHWIEPETRIVVPKNLLQRMKGL